MQPVTPAEKLAPVSMHWSPKIVGSFKGLDRMIAKVLEEFVWHHHPDTDDVLTVLAGQRFIDLPEDTITLSAGEVFVVPKGRPHRPRAAVETRRLPIETADTGTPATATTRVRS